MPTGSCNFTRNCHNLTRTCHNLTRICPCKQDQQEAIITELLSIACRVVDSSSGLISKQEILCYMQSLCALCRWLSTALLRRLGGATEVSKTYAHLADNAMYIHLFGEDLAHLSPSHKALYCQIFCSVRKWLSVCGLADCPLGSSIVTPRLIQIASAVRARLDGLWTVGLAPLISDYFKQTTTCSSSTSFYLNLLVELRSLASVSNCILDRRLASLVTTEAPPMHAKVRCLTRTCQNLTRTCHNLTRNFHNLTRTCHNLTRRLAQRSTSLCAQS